MLNLAVFCDSFSYRCDIGYLLIVLLMRYQDFQDMDVMEPTMVDGNGTETGHIIVTTIGGKNGQSKQVKSQATTVTSRNLSLKSLNLCSFEFNFSSYKLSLI